MLKAAGCALGFMGFVWGQASQGRDATAAAQAPTAACPEVSIPASSDWPESDGEPSLLLHVDLDGDGRADTLEIQTSQGSGFSSTFVTVELTGGPRVEVVVEGSSYSMLMDTDIPTELLAPGRECVLAAVEKAAFGAIDAGPDPSLEWLLAERKSLRWVEGPPVLPRSYTLRRRDAEGAHWTSYKGLLHAYREGRGPLPPVVLARRAGRVLLATSHGVILTDPARSRHAWIYVSAGSEEKLRHASIRGARIVGHTAVITLEPSSPEARPETVRVDLETGSLG